MNKWGDEGKNYYEMSPKQLDKDAAIAAELFIAEHPENLLDP